MSNTESHRRIYLSPPQMSARDRELLLEAFDSGWIAPLGPQVDAFETEFSKKLGVQYAVALNCGTSALHLALLALGIGPHDRVATSTLTFIASANAIRYTGATPVFIDSEPNSWNLDPELLSVELETSLQQEQPIKAVLVVDALGQCADYDAIRRVCNFYEIPLVEDAAESLGATYRGTAAGALGDVGCFSFNGNKIITTSSGGMLVTSRREIAEMARHLATQAREPTPHYEHSELGYNYRMSNLLAAVGRGQLEQLDARVAKRRHLFDQYSESLSDLPGIAFMPEASYGTASRWLTCITVDPDKFGASRDDLRLALEDADIESRPVWKPMHLQPLYAACQVRGGDVSEHLFECGLCLPSGSSLVDSDVARIVGVIRAACRKAVYHTSRGVTFS